MRVNLKHDGRVMGEDIRLGAHRVGATVQEVEGDAPPSYRITPPASSAVVAGWVTKPVEGEPQDVAIPTVEMEVTRTTSGLHGTLHVRFRHRISETILYYFLAGAGAYSVMHVTCEYCEVRTTNNEHSNGLLAVAGIFGVIGCLCLGLALRQTYRISRDLRVVWRAWRCITDREVQ